MIDIKEIRLKKFDDIKNILNDLLNEQFKLKLQAASGQLAKSSEKRRVKKDIARIKTVLKEMKENG
jgi:large subunit ribosomal protein L29|tara:strand:+ start:1665 stop:1862 length:198 start_codon:yes stop_codon:yes gene_type:complete